MNASNRAEGGTSAFSWVADPSSRLVVTATNSRYSFRHSEITPFCEGVMRRTGGGWDRSFFWQFVNAIHGSCSPLERVVLLDATPANSTRSSPCFWRHSLPPFLLPADSARLEIVPVAFQSRSMRFLICEGENRWIWILPVPERLRTSL